MSFGEIIIYVIAGIAAIGFIMGLIAAILQWREDGIFIWPAPIFGLFIIFLLPLAFIIEMIDFFIESKKDGGLLEHYRNEKQRKQEDKRREKEYKRICEAYKKGELRREELPRKCDGIRGFEFYGNLLCSDWQDLIYIENEHNDVLNDFFERHPEIPLKHDLRIIYLPKVAKDLNSEEVLRYWNPGSTDKTAMFPSIDTSSLLNEVCYPEDRAKLAHGLISCFGWSNNHGAEYLHVKYYPIEEADDDGILRQIEAIAKEVYEYNSGGLYCKIERPSEEKEPTKSFADEQFDWEIRTLVDEIRERVDKLEQRGVPRKLLMKLLQDERKLSRIIITKDMRIMLPDYNHMEIKMEPINKAVFLLFLRHPNGIKFKNLPDYRKELAEIYEKIKPSGLSARAIQSIEDVTNPCLNSINEKCARIRGAFISQFDEELAQHYYITGWRGEPKKIDIPLDLVIWEKE